MSRLDCWRLLLATGISTSLGIVSWQVHAEDLKTLKRAPDDTDDPPPSMALLEFVALFETADGQWMDLNDIPVPLEEQMQLPERDTGDQGATEPAIPAATLKPADSTEPQGVPVSVH